MPNGQQNTIKGKLVYRTCAAAVVQVTDSNYFHFTQDKWRRTAMDDEFEHVFVVKNYCDFLFSNLKTGDDFSFIVSDSNNLPKGCESCELYDYLPKNQLGIKVINE